MPTLRYCIKIKYWTRYSSIIIKYWWSRNFLLVRKTDYYHFHQIDWSQVYVNNLKKKILRWKILLRNIHFMTSKLKINLSQNQQVQVDNEEPFRILIELRPDMAPKVRFRNFHSTPISLSINKQHICINGNLNFFSYSLIRLLIYSSLYSSS